MRLDDKILKVYTHGNWAKKYRVIYFKSDWFTDDYYSIIEFNDYFIIRKHYINIPKDAHKYTKSYELYFKSSIKKGVYIVDEDDSDEDELYIYHSTRTDLNKNK